jgi:outer membrane protein
MKKFFVVILAGLICGALGAGGAIAAEGGMKMATMDLKKVLELSKTGQVVQATVKQKYEEYQAKLGKKEEAMLALKEEIEKKRSVWSEDVRTQKERDFKRGVQDLDEESKDANTEMKDFERKQIEPILKELEGIIDEYGKAQGLSVILDTTRGIVYQDANLDISATIAAELDKRHPAGEAKADPEVKPAEAKSAAVKPAKAADSAEAKPAEAKTSAVKPAGKSAKADAKR